MFLFPVHLFINYSLFNWLWLRNMTIYSTLSVRFRLIDNVEENIRNEKSGAIMVLVFRHSWNEWTRICAKLAVELCVSVAWAGGWISAPGPGTPLPRESYAGEYLSGGQVAFIREAALLYFRYC